MIMSCGKGSVVRTANAQLPMREVKLACDAINTIRVYYCPSLCTAAALTFCIVSVLFGASNIVSQKIRTVETILCLRHISIHSQDCYPSPRLDKKCLRKPCCTNNLPQQLRFCIKVRKSLARMSSPADDFGCFPYPRPAVKRHFTRCLPGKPAYWHLIASFRICSIRPG